MNAPTCSPETEVDYLITNATTDKATGEWVVTTYSQRNWVEVFYREAKGWLAGLKQISSPNRASSLLYMQQIRHGWLVANPQIYKI